MHIVIPLRRVPDTETKIGVVNGQIDESSLKSWVINPYDEYALEEALRLNESRGEGKVTVVTIGPEAAQETIRKALAMGADEAYHLQDDAFETLDPLGRARVMAAAIGKLGDFDLIWTGWKSVDEDHGQMGVLLAEFLDLPHVSTVLTIDEVGSDSVTVTAHGEGGTLKVRAPLPALLTESQGPNEPRYPSLKGIMGAKKKPLTVWTAADLGLNTDDLEPVLELVSVERPPARAAGRIIEGDVREAARELVRLLHEEAKAI